MFSTFVTSVGYVPGWTFSKCPAERKALTLAATIAMCPNLDEKMFRAQKVYIQIKRNQVTAVNLETGEEVTRTAFKPFSTERVVLASFNPANDTVLAAIRDLRIKTTFAAMKVAIQQLEGAEGGLSDIEKRALRDLAEMAGAGKVYIVEGERKLSIDQALALIEGRAA